MLKNDVIRMFWTKTASFAMFLAPIAALAQGKDEDARPMPPEALQFQRSALGVIALVVLAAVGFYYFRRWQTVRSGRSVDGS